MADKDKALVCQSGWIKKGPDFSPCMDGATHVLLKKNGSMFRLKAHNDKVHSLLEKAESDDHQYSVCGYEVQSAECAYLEIHSVLLTAELESKLKTAALV